MADFEAAKTLFLQGASHLDAGRPADAEACLLQSLQHLPGRPSTLVNLALARLALHRPADALAALDEALAADPAAPDAQCHRAVALATLGRLDEAAAQLQPLLAAHPGFAAAWAVLGQLEKDRGRPDDARNALRQAIAHGDTRSSTQYTLAALGEGDAPPAAPPEYVRALFDGYADDFENHLVDVLRYRGHEAVVQAAAAGAPHASALDLGCGTGLCGPGLRPLCTRLVGVDLSATMVGRARVLGVYDEVLQAEAVQHLQGTAERHDLVCAADVLIYFGDLSPVLAGVRRVLRPGGRFVFSTELAPGPAPWTLHESGRYAHAETPLLALCAAHGFLLAGLQRCTLREEQRQPVAGLVVSLRAP